MIDTSIITNGALNAQNIQGSNSEALQQLLGLGGKALLNRKIGQMRDISDPTARKDFANQGLFKNALNRQYTADQVLATEQQRALERHNADIGKTQSEAFKNNQQGTGYQVDANQKKLGAIQGAFIGAAQTGDKTQVLLGLSALNRSGLMTPEDLTAYTEMIKVATPEDVKKMAQGFALQNAKDPASHLFTTADNVLDNETSIQNNELNNQTSRLNNQENNQTTISVNDAKLNQDQKQFDAELYVKQNKPLDYFTAADGTRYAVYANGQGIPISDGKGSVLKEKPKNAETPIQKMERQEKAIDFSVAAQGAAEGSKLAAILANDLKGINSSGGASPINWAARKIPGTNAFNYTQKLETLKANVFLSQVSKMKGMGALTEAEGARLEKAIASLDANQDPVQLQKNLTEISKQLSLIAKTNSNKTKIYAGTSGQSSAPAQATSSGFDVKSFFNE